MCKTERCEPLPSCESGILGSKRARRRALSSVPAALSWGNVEIFGAEPRVDQAAAVHGLQFCTTTAVHGLQFCTATNGMQNTAYLPKKSFCRRISMPSSGRTPPNVSPSLRHFPLCPRSHLIQLNGMLLTAADVHARQWTFALVYFAGPCRVVCRPRALYGNNLRFPTMKYVTSGYVSSPSGFCSFALSPHVI